MSKIVLLRESRTMARQAIVSTARKHFDTHGYSSSSRDEMMAAIAHLAAMVIAAEPNGLVQFNKHLARELSTLKA
jgi:hypothetical protein